MSDEKKKPGIKREPLDLLAMYEYINDLCTPEAQMQMSGITFEPVPGQPGMVKMKRPDRGPLYGSAKAGADAIEKLKEFEWVPVVRQLPMLGVPVLITDGKKQCTVVRVDDEDHPWKAWGWGGYIYEMDFMQEAVTHWMPLQAPPEVA